MQRLRKRGDAQASITRRIIEGNDWDQLATSLNVPFRFILNNQTIQYLLEHAEEYIFEKEP